MYGSFSPWLLPLLVVLESSQLLRSFYSFPRTKNSAETHSSFSWKIRVKIHVQKARASVAASLLTEAEKHQAHSRETLGVEGAAGGGQMHPCSPSLQKAVCWLRAYANLTSDPEVKTWGAESGDSCVNCRVGYL